MPSILKTTDYRNFTIDGEKISFLSLDRVLPNDEVVSGGGGKFIAVKRAKIPLLVGTLDIINKTRYGFTSRGQSIYLFTPMNRAYPTFRVGSSIDPKENRNYLIVVKYESWELGSSMPRGICTQILGHVGSFEAEAEALYWFYSPWSMYTKKTGNYSQSDKTEQTESRYDMTNPFYGWKTFNVDPIGCRDIDDVFSYRLRNDKAYECAITIADVSSLIPAGSLLDSSARRIGQSLYHDGHKPRHMLPASISEEFGSLVAGEKRFGITLFFLLQEDKITNPVFKKTIIQNDTTYTYETIYDNTEHSTILKKLAIILMPNATIDALNDSHEWIASIMVYYNMEFASILREKRKGLLRAHAEPDMDRLLKLKSVDANLIYLAFSSAIYLPANTDSSTKHYGLDAIVYTHATSPLRRYADLVNQRAFTETTTNEDTLLAEELNITSKLAKKHDRDYHWLLTLQNSQKTVTPVVLVSFQSKHEDIITIEAYATEWKRFVKIKYRGTLQEDGSASVISKDEKIAFILNVGDSCDLAYSADYSKVSWKDRLILSLIPKQIIFNTVL